MSKISATSFGKVLLQAALAAILFLSGLAIFIDGSRNQVIGTIGSIFANHDVRTIIAYVIAVFELVAGVLLLLDFFAVRSLERANDIALLVIIIIWIIFMVLADVFPLVNSRIVFMQWLYQLAQHTLILAGLIIVRAKV